MPIYYESRLAKISLNQPNLPKIDQEIQDLLDSELLDDSKKKNQIKLV